MKFIIFTLIVVGIVAALPHEPRKSGHERIVGGSQATKGEFPYIVEIREGGRHHCGGTIVNANYIVTSATCAAGTITGYSVVAGEHNLNLNDGTEQTRNVSRIVRHPNFSSSTLANDVAVMRVSSPFQMNTAVRAVTIPAQTFRPGNQLVTAGWGALTNGGSFATILMKVNVPLVANTTCRSTYGNQYLAGMTCAGASGRDFCQGDFGGPLMNLTTLVGISSWQRGCGAAGYPSVYTDVPYFSNWIRQNTV